MLRTSCSTVKSCLPLAGIDDVSEAILVLIALLRDQVTLQQAAMGAGEIREIDLDVMAVVVGQRPIGLAENQILLRPDGGTRARAVLVLAGFGKGADHARGRTGRCRRRCRGARRTRRRACRA